MAEELTNRILSLLVGRTVVILKHYGINITPEQINTVMNMRLATSNTCCMKLSKGKGKEEKQCPRPRQPGSPMCAYHNNMQHKKQKANAPTPVTDLFVPSLSLSGINFIPVGKDMMIKPLPPIPLSSLPKPPLPSHITNLPQ